MMEIQFSQDLTFMKLAFALAETPLGAVSPNPYVGAIVVKDGKIIGKGYHPKAGEPHAEIFALNEAGADAKDATIYISLEPCCHHGRTPPCTDAIIRAGIKHVVYAIDDINPSVAGKSKAILENAGITVHCLNLDEAYALNRVFFHNQKTHLPYITLKSALSLDGKIATQSYDSKWITGDAARKKTHEIRAKHDAILIGKNTLFNDNPELSVRYDYANYKQPIRILLLRNFDHIHVQYQIFNTIDQQTWIIYPEHILVPDTLLNEFIASHVQLIPCQSDEYKDSVSIPALLSLLYQKRVMSVLLEGGSAIYDLFLSNSAVDECALFYGPRLIGNQSAPSLWDNSTISSLSTAPILSIVHTEQIEESVYIEARFNKG